MDEAHWCTAAESALAALYALHPRPQEIAGAMLRARARRVLGQHYDAAGMEVDDASAHFA